MNETEYIDKIEHRGIVKSVRPGAVTVAIESGSGEGCGSCPAARICGAANRDSIEIATHDAAHYRPGDSVMISGTERMHRRAIMLATVLPCITLVATMVIIWLLTGSQAGAAFGGLAMTIIFYVILYLCRNRIAHEFIFTIRKI